MTDAEKHALEALLHWYRTLLAWEQRPVDISTADQIVLFGETRIAYERLLAACEEVYGQSRP